jgi:hypothetical protein
MDDRSVTDRAIGSQSGSQVVRKVNDTPVLNVRSFADTYGFDIATEHGSVKHTGILSQANIPDDRCVACHKSGSL